MKEELDEKNLEFITGETTHAQTNMIQIDDYCAACKAIKFKFNVGDKVDITSECDGDSVVLERVKRHNLQYGCKAYYYVKYNFLHISFLQTGD